MQSIRASFGELTVESNLESLRELHGGEPCERWKSGLICLLCQALNLTCPDQRSIMDRQPPINSYPDPSVENGPFYGGGQQPDVPASMADIQLANELQQQIGPNMNQHVQHHDPSTPPNTTGMGPDSNDNAEQKTSPKKRAKAGRACDHCSSKKQGCVMEPNNTSCVRCLKGNIQCTFRKQPGKRGPNPG